MDEKLKNELKKIKDLIESRQVDLALSEIDRASNRQDMQPYAKALQKLKYDIDYAKKIDSLGLGDKAYAKIKSELDSITKGHIDKPKTKEHIPKPAQTKQGNVALPPPLPPLLPMPSPIQIKVPKEFISEDPYNLEDMDILQEIGPWGALNDLRRTAASMLDPLLPYKILKKEVKK